MSLNPLDMVKWKEPRVINDLPLASNNIEISISLIKGPHGIVQCNPTKFIITSKNFIVVNKNHDIIYQIEGRNEVIENQNDSDSFDQMINHFMECYKPLVETLLRLLLTHSLWMLMFPSLNVNLGTMCLTKLSMKMSM